MTVILPATPFAMANVRPKGVNPSGTGSLRGLLGRGLYGQKRFPIARPGCVFSEGIGESHRLCPVSFRRDPATFNSGTWLAWRFPDGGMPFNSGGLFHEAIRTSVTLCASVPAKW